MLKSWFRTITSVTIYLKLLLLHNHCQEAIASIVMYHDMLYAIAITLLLLHNCCYQKDLQLCDLIMWLNENSMSIARIWAMVMFTI
jgi:hypothetical protein